MQATEVILPDKIFNFSGQSRFDTWNLRETLEKAGWSADAQWLVDELPFCLQGIRERVRRVSRRPGTQELPRSTM